MVGPPKPRSNGGRIVVVLKWLAVSDTVLVLIIEKKKSGLDKEGHIENKSGGRDRTQA